MPGPPVVGDCVLDPIGTSWDNPAVAGSALSGAPTTYAYPRLAMKPCQGSRYGEVTALIQTATEPVISISSDGTFVNDANVETCSPAASEYVGIAMVGTQRAPLDGVWYPSQTVDAAASVPSIRQAAAGQHWLACIVYLGASAGSQQTVADQERYDGPLRGSMSSGQQGNRIGTCATGSDLTGGTLGLTGCGVVHRSEIFATGGSDARPLSRTNLQASCDRVVAHATGIPNITTAGFTVQVLAIDSTGAHVTSASIPAGLNLSCGVTAEHERKLDGSLLALGDRPIPWV